MSRSFSFSCLISFSLLSSLYFFTLLVREHVISYRVAASPHHLEQHAETWHHRPLPTTCQSYNEDILLLCRGSPFASLNPLFASVCIVSVISVPIPISSKIASAIGWKGECRVKLLAPCLLV